MSVRRSQRTVRQGLGLLPLSGSRDRLNSAVPSPYFQRNQMREEAPGRDIQLFLKPMKAFVQTFGLADDGTGNLATAVNVQFHSGVTFVAATIAPLIGYNADNGDDVIAAAITAILGYATSQSFSITAADIVWPQVMASAAARAESALTLTVQTSTGAVGTQVSTTQDSLVLVDLSTTTTASIAGNAALDLVLEVAPTNSATAGDWVTKGRTGNSQALSLAITLQSVQANKSQAIAYVPKGYYVKVRSTGASGTTASAVVEARKVLL